MEGNKSAGLMEIKQDVITDSIIESLGLGDGMVKGKYTPSEAKPLIKGEDG